MKKLLLTLAAIGLTLSAFGQGTVIIDNYDAVGRVKLEVPGTYYTGPFGLELWMKNGSAADNLINSFNGGAVVEALGKAKSTVLVQAYSFTSALIAKALVEAHRRGVKVEVVLDKSQRTQKYRSATFVYNSGMPCFIDAQHAIAHNKVMVIDGVTVIIGLFNFTKATFRLLFMWIGAIS